MSDDDFKQARRDKAQLNDPTKVDRLPPHSVEAEQGVLGCILLAPAECMGKCIEVLKAGSLAFYMVAHQGIYGTLLAMHDEGKAIDLITLQQRLRDNNRLEEIGGVPFLASLPDTVPSAANLGHYLDIVREKFALRRWIGLCTGIVQRCYEESGEVNRLIDEIEADFSRLTEEDAAVVEEHIRTVSQRVVDNIERHYNRGTTQLRGLSTGPAGNHLDKLVRGIRETYYYVIAGRPGGGKTSWAMNLVEHLALDFEWWQPTGKMLPPAEGETEERAEVQHRKGIPVFVFSLEMDAESLVERMLFARSGVDTAQFSQGFATAGYHEKLAVATKELVKSKIYICDAGDLSAAQIAAMARRAVGQYGLKGILPPGVPRMVFVLDYIQLVESENDRDDERAAVKKISRKIKVLKKQLKCPWIVLVQMNRAIETAERERKPVLSDLKGADDIAHHADVVEFVHRSTRKESEEDEDIIERVAAAKEWKWSERPYRIDHIVPKNRYGPTGLAQAVFVKNLCRFEDWHGWKMKHGVEAPKQGERKQEEFTGEGVAENWPKGKDNE